MYISVVTLPVGDMDRAIEFYTTKLGWEKTMDVPMDNGRWVTIAPSGAQTAFVLSTTNMDGTPTKPGGPSGVVIEVDDVHKTCEQLKGKGVAFADGPRDESWGGWAMFTDSEGNQHGLHSPVAAGFSNN